MWFTALWTKLCHHLAAPGDPLIRAEIGFDGLLMTDDISMKALNGTPEEISRASLKAGCDVVLIATAICPTRIALMAGIGAR